MRTLFFVRIFCTVRLVYLLALESAGLSTRSGVLCVEHTSAAGPNFAPLFCEHVFLDMYIGQGYARGTQAAGATQVRRAVELSDQHSIVRGCRKCILRSRTI